LIKEFCLITPLIELIDGLFGSYIGIILSYLVGSRLPFPLAYLF